jgi:hypothetical protein
MWTDIYLKNLSVGYTQERKIGVHKGIYDLPLHASEASDV